MTLDPTIRTRLLELGQDISVENLEGDYCRPHDCIEVIEQARQDFTEEEFTTEDFNELKGLYNKLRLLNPSHVTDCKAALHLEWNALLGNGFEPCALYYPKDKRVILYDGTESRDKALHGIGYVMHARVEQLSDMFNVQMDSLLVTGEDVVGMSYPR